MVSPVVSLPGLLSLSRHRLIVPEAEIQHDSPSLPSGELRLWFAVFLNSFIALRDQWGSQDTARQWIEDPDNEFFWAVADHLGFTPEAMRERVRRALQLAAKVERQTWQDRIRERMRREAAEAKRG